MNYKDFNDRICKLVRPRTFPLALKIINKDGSYSGKVTRPKKYGIKISLCQWTTMARRWGRTLGVYTEDINCTPCLAALGLKKLSNPEDLSHYFMEMGYFENHRLAEMALKQLDPLVPGQISGVVMQPLEKAEFDPDVVLIYGTPSQMARLTSGFVYHTGELIESKTTGFGISCLSALRPFFSGKPALVHPGRGERILAGTDEDEMFFTFPSKDLARLARGLEKTHEKGTRYPVQSYVIYQPPEIQPVKNLGKKLADI